MKAPLKKNGTVIATYAVAALLFGVLVTKIFEYEALKSVFVASLAVILLLALVVLCWILGWTNGNNK